MGPCGCVVVVAVDPPWRQTPLAKICQSSVCSGSPPSKHTHTHTLIHHSLTHSQRHRSAAAAAAAPATATTTTAAEFEIRSTGLAACSGGPEPVTRAYAVVFAYDLGCHHQEEEEGHGVVDGEQREQHHHHHQQRQQQQQLSYRRQRNMRSVPFRSLVVSFIAPQFVQFSVCSLQLLWGRCTRTLPHTSELSTQQSGWKEGGVVGWCKNGARVKWCGWWVVGGKW